LSDVDDDTPEEFSLDGWLFNRMLDRVWTPEDFSKYAGVEAKRLKSLIAGHALPTFDEMNKMAAALMAPASVPLDKMIIRATRSNVGAWLYHRLLMRAWTQAELSRNSGVHRDRLTAFILGTDTPTTEEMDKLVAALTAPEDRDGLPV
jgi:hypothetical protein